MAENEDQDLMVFVDGTNLLNRMRDYRRASNDYKFFIDPDRLANFLTAKYRLADKLRFYSTEPIEELCRPKGFEERKSFLRKFAASLLYETIICSKPRVYQRRCAHVRVDYPNDPCPFMVRIAKERDVDLNLAVDMLLFAPKYTVAMLVSSDSDYAPVIRRIRERYPTKHIVNVVLCWKKRSHELIRSCDRGYGRHFIDLDQFIGAIKEVREPQPA